MCFLIQHHNATAHAKTLPEAIEKAKALVADSNDEALIYQCVRVVKPVTKIEVIEYKTPHAATE